MRITETKEGIEHRNPFVAIIEQEAAKFLVDGGVVDVDERIGRIDVTSSMHDKGYAPFVSAFTEATGRAPELDAENFVPVRERFGGPGKNALEAAIASYRQGEAAFTVRSEERIRREADAAKELDQKIAELAGGA